MYKIFIENKEIILTDKKTKFLDSDINNKIKLKNINKLQEQFEDFVKSKVYKKCMIYHWDIDELFCRFKLIFKYIHAAGGIVRNKKGQFLFIYRNDKWDLPKGKLEKKESPEICSVREVKEECGITKVKLMNLIKITYHAYQLKNKWELKKTWWYEMKSDFDGKFIPQLEEGITKVEWLSIEEVRAIKKYTFKSIRKILKLFKDLN